MSDRGLGAVVTDFSPLREQLQWLEDVKKGLPEDIPLIQVKAHGCREDLQDESQWIFWSFDLQIQGTFLSLSHSGINSILQMVRFSLSTETKNRPFFLFWCRKKDCYRLLNIFLLTTSISLIMYFAVIQLDQILCLLTVSIRRCTHYCLSTI